MEETLARLDTVLRQYRDDYHGKLLPGATPEEIQACGEQIGIALPPALIALYRWRNGQKTGTYARFAGSYTRTPLKGAREAHRILTDLQRAGDFGRENGWRPAWIPFLENGSGDHLCVDTEGTFTGQAGQVIEFRHDGEARPVFAPGLEAWLTDLVGYLEAELPEADPAEVGDVLLDGARASRGIRGTTRPEERDPPGSPDPPMRDRTSGPGEVSPGPRLRGQPGGSCGGNAGPPGS